MAEFIEKTGSGFDRQEKTGSRSDPRNSHGSATLKETMLRYIHNRLNNILLTFKETSAWYFFLIFRNAGMKLPNICTILNSN